MGSGRRGKREEKRRGRKKGMGKREERG